jgi:two-component system, OmpR family, sensor histidine kinase TctE
VLDHPAAVPDVTPASSSARVPRVKRLLPFGYSGGTRSLFGEILDWMLAPLLVIWPLSIMTASLVAQSLANKPFDRALEDEARVLAAQVRFAGNANEAGFDLSSATRSLLQSDSAVGKSFQVLGPRGELLGGEVNLPLPAKLAEAATTGLGKVSLRDDIFNNENVRVASLWVSAPRNALPGAQAQGVLVQVAENPTRREALASEIIKGVIFPQFAILPLSVLLVYLGLARGIRPLHLLQQDIRERNPDDISPINEQETPDELRPLVVAINDLLAKQQTSLAAQKRFIADAAHQMKTPLAGLRMQAELAQRQTDPAELRASLAQLVRSTTQATHVVNQLLALARTEHKREQTARQSTPFDLTDTAANVVHELAPLAFDKRIDLGFDAEESVMLRGDQLMVAELVKNLLDNALRYTPPEGSVTVMISRDPITGAAVLCVEDSGPGIDPAIRPLVFEPFYRALGSGTDGSGLGLAIAREIATQHGATIELSDNAKLAGSAQPGTRVTVRFAVRTATA